MSDDNSMDVDDVPKTILPSPVSSEVDEFKTEMIEASRRERWSSRAGSDKEEPKDLLYSVLVHCGSIVSSQPDLQKTIITLGFPAVKRLVQSLNDDEVEEWRNIVQKGDWVDLIKHPKLQKPAEDLVVDGQAENILYGNGGLGKQHFIGDSATEFIKHLEQADIGQETNEQTPLYAKAISVVQSSGTGKSRMLTEVGKQIFTLPICLRKSTDTGYPPGDKPVVDFFSALPQDNHLSVTAHAAIACFLAAAPQTMLETLQEARKKGLNGPRLLGYWNGLMEPTWARDRRRAFFTKVVEQADSLMKSAVKTFKNDTVQNIPISGKDGQEPLDFQPYEMSRKHYELHAQEATEKLTQFLSDVLPGKRISVMYFDEAHELGLHFWIFLRLVQHQLSSTKIWYTFMGTKSSISYYAPPSKRSLPPRSCPTEATVLSLRLKQEAAPLLPPYIDLGFDQRAIAKSGAPVTVRIGDMEAIEFISQYGRPLWGSHLPEEPPGQMIALASWKLLSGDVFRAEDKDHVFAVLSQRLCLDPVLATAEGIELANRSVTRHMRLLTGFSTDSDKFYTHSPSEPVLVMGSIDIMYNTSQPDLLGQALNTLSKDLCGAGLVEKGILGELGARILILIARDFAAAFHSHPRRRNLLRPVSLLDFLLTLFGKNGFTHSDKLTLYNTFRMVFVNFTHWICTRDAIPEELDEQLLANLWARGAALQCCFSQESIYFLIPLYHGSVYRDSKFDPSQLSAVVVQVKHEFIRDENSEPAIRPIGVRRDRHKPLPYVVIIMDLDSESRYADRDLKIKCPASEPPDGEFGILCDAWDAAVKELETYRSGKNTEKDILEGLKKKIDDARLAVDSCNRYLISARGLSPFQYGVLNEAKIEREFAALLKITMPPPAEVHSTKEHMRPLERLWDDSPHTAWMSDYTVPNKGGDDVDP